jgi:hypothetical protein
MLRACLKNGNWPAAASVTLDPIAQPKHLAAAAQFRFFGQTLALPVWILLLALSGGPVFGLEIINQGYASKMELPDGYENITKNMGGKALVALRKVDAATHTITRLVMVTDLGAIIDQDGLTRRQSGTNLTMESARWKNFDLPVCKITEDKGTTFNLQVPFKPHALQITVFGPNKDVDQLRTELQTILKSADGPTNWMTVAELKASIRWALIRAGLAFVAIVGLIVFLVRRRRTAQVTIDDFRT